MIRNWLRTWVRRYFRISPRPATTRLRPRRTVSSLHVESLETRIVPTTFQWVGAGADTNWSTAANWNTVGSPTNGNAFPNATDDVARFTAVLGATQNVVVDQALTVGEIDFGTTDNVTIGGTNALTLQNAGPHAILNAGQAFANRSDGVALMVVPSASAAGGDFSWSQPC